MLYTFYTVLFSRVGCIGRDGENGRSSNFLEFPNFSQLLGDFKTGEFPQLFNVCLTPLLYRNLQSILANSIDFLIWYGADRKQNILSPNLVDPILVLDLNNTVSSIHSSHFQDLGRGNLIRHLAQCTECSPSFTFP